MKKFLLLFAFLPFAVAAKDIVVLQNGHSFEGDVVRIGLRFLHFESAGTHYRIPAEDLRYVGLDEALDNDVDVCLRAYNDTRLRGRHWHNFFGGVLFGPATIIYDLIKTYHPLHDRRVLLLSKNKGYFSDPVYLECYNYRAKTNATLQAAAGWATWLVFFKN